MMGNARSVTDLQPIADSAACPICGLHHAAGAACPIATALPVRAAGLLLVPGTLLGGRFEIEDVAHRSGMSTVYRARENGGVRVAIKQVSLAGLTAVERAESQHWLAREAGLLSSLHNQHLPELIAAFSEGDDHYVVMPYLEGETLKELVTRNGPLPEAEALHWAQILAEVLAYLHGQDPPIIHRDLKPDNVLILQGLRLGFDGSAPPDDRMSNGRLILLDLGVARPLTRGILGTAIGTPGYAAPEQYQGLADERSDLYALGATLHYMLTGYDAEREAPFRHPPVHELRPEVSPEVADAIAGLLHIVPEERAMTAERTWAYFGLMADTSEFDLARDLVSQAIGRAIAISAIAGCSGLLYGLFLLTPLMDQGSLGAPWGFAAWWLAWITIWTSYTTKRRFESADSLTERAYRRLVRTQKMCTAPVVGCWLLTIAVVWACAIELSAPRWTYACILFIALSSMSVTRALVSRTLLDSTAKRERLSREGQHPSESLLRT